MKLISSYCNAVIGSEYTERRGCNDMTFSCASHSGFKPHHVIYSGKLQPISSLMVTLCLKLM